MHTTPRRTRHHRTPGQDAGRPRPATDLLHLLARAHRRHDHAARRLRRQPAELREPALRRLGIDVLAHEAIEQLVLHPLVAARLPDGRRLAALRIREEASLEQLLLEALAPRPGASAAAALDAFCRHLGEHDDREEIEVFPYLRHVVDPDDLGALGIVASQLHDLLVRDDQALPSDEPLRHVRDLAAAAFADLDVELPPDVEVPGGPGARASVAFGPADPAPAGRR